jgi:hypothetical protein
MNQLKDLEKKPVYMLVYKDGTLFNNRVYRRKPSSRWVANPDWKIVTAYLNIVKIEETK